MRDGQGHMCMWVLGRHTPAQRQRPQAPLGGHGTPRKDHRSLRHFCPSCHESAAKTGGPGSLRTLPLGFPGSELGQIRLASVESKVSDYCILF